MCQGRCRQPSSLDTHAHPPHDSHVRMLARFSCLALLASRCCASKPRLSSVHSPAAASSPQLRSHGSALSCLLRSFSSRAARVRPSTPVVAPATIPSFAPKPVLGGDRPPSHVSKVVKTDRAQKSGLLFAMPSHNRSDCKNRMRAQRSCRIVVPSL
jgi:hypothetical protein